MRFLVVHKATILNVLDPESTVEERREMGKTQNPQTYQKPIIILGNPIPNTREENGKW